MTNKFSILNGAKYFSSRIFQNYLVFVPAKLYVKYFSGTTWNKSWKSNGMSEENVENITELHSNFARTFVHHHLLPDIHFNGRCLFNNNISISKQVLNLYIFLLTTPWLRNINPYFSLNNSLFGSVNLTEKADPEKYNYSGYDIRFDSSSEFSSFGKMSLFLELI